ncbi:MAG TPA: rRNA maturation RNase YbeY [Candidatus Limnocylindrales bacterium]|nr:rRNA maturation RNase YbeY [Candidatus Limnocylindrales bacterium]
MNVVIANRQRTKKINARLLKQITAALLAELKVQEAELGISLVAAPEMTLVNETFLQHEGSTDVITFDYEKSEVRSQKLEKHLHGELYICVDDAIAQAKSFKTSWQWEVVRYVVHGVLHLLGHDDLQADLRRKMKREENRLVRLLARRFALAQLSCPAKMGA